MNITSNELAQSLKISTNYLFKVCNCYGLMKREYYTLSHLQFLLNSIENNNYKKLLLKSNLEKVIDDLKEVHNV